MIDEGEGRVDGNTNLDHLAAGPVVTWLEVRDLVAVVEHDSHEVVEQESDEHLIRCQSPGPHRGLETKVVLVLQAAEEEESCQTLLHQHRSLSLL